MTIINEQDAILQMLNLNIVQETIQGQGPEWKVLIYDRLGQDVISPLLKVNELRENGITVHLPVTKERFPIPDVPAVYFVQPTQENIQLIANVWFINMEIISLQKKTGSCKTTL